MHFLSRDISTRWPWLCLRPVCVKKQQQCNDVLQSPGQRPLHHVHGHTVGMWSVTIHQYRMAREWWIVHAVTCSIWHCIGNSDLI